MSQLSFINQLRYTISRGWRGYRHGESNTTRPLLEDGEILDLRHRAEHFRGIRDHSHEVDQRAIGDTRSVYRGHGIDYDESRIYYPGDELRFMNWRVTARTGEPHIKVFREERKPGVFIVFDRRDSMRFGTRRRLKATQAARAAALMAFNARIRNEPLAGTLLGTEDRKSMTWIPETSDEAGVHDFIQRCCMPCPLPDNKDTSSGFSQSVTMHSLLKQLVAILKTGCRLVLISDFHDLEDACRSSLIELSISHQVQAIQIIDPAEINLPDCGHLFTRSKNNSLIEIDTSNRNQRFKYNDMAAQFVESKAGTFKSLGINSQQLMTNVDDIELILEA